MMQPGGHEGGEDLSDPTLRRIVLLLSLLLSDGLDEFQVVLLLQTLQHLSQVFPEAGVFADLLAIHHPVLLLGIVTLLDETVAAGVMGVYCISEGHQKSHQVGEAV